MMFLKGLGTPINKQKASEYFEKSAEQGNQYAKRLLAFEYISEKNFEQNIEKGIALLTECADGGDAFSCYQLGSLYFFGADGLEKDKEKAIQLLNLSAEQGNEYAQILLDNTEQLENEMLASTIFNLFVNLSRCIEDDYHNKFQSGRKMIDSKLRRVIQEKNQALGIKQEHGQTQEY